MALSPSKDLIVIGYLAVAASLIFAGVLQWLVLRRLIADTGWWVLVSVGAAAIVGVLVFGLGLINRDVGWVLANMLGLIVAIPVVGFVTWATGAPVDSAIGGFLRWLAFGAAYGVVTGTTLSWLQRQRLGLAMP